MASALSLRVSDLTRITDTAKPTAAASAMRLARRSGRWLAGRTISATPNTPSAIASTFHALMRSCRNTAASSADQIGIVNSMATTCASGISVSATNQPYCAA